MFFLRNFIHTIARLQRRTKVLIKLSFDFFLVTLAFIFSLFFTPDLVSAREQIIVFGVYLLSTTLFLTLMYLSGVYSAVTRYASVRTPKYIFFISILVAAIMHFSMSLSGISVPVNLSILFGLLCLTATIGIRLIVQQTFNTNFRNDRKPVAIYGAGEAGMKLLAALENSIEYVPMMLVDDNPKLHGLKFRGLEVVSLETAGMRLSPLNIKTILLAMPSVKNNLKKQIIDNLTKFSVEVKSVPKFSDLIEGNLAINKVADVSFDALLGRDIVPPVDSLMSEDITSKTVLITGAGGSIGTELCKQAILLSPKRIILFEQSEYNLYKINYQLEEFCNLNNIKTAIIPVLGLLQNQNKIHQIFKTYSVDTVYHAAAYKHVHMMEMNVTEAILNNIKATHILVAASNRFNIKKFVLISSDKAVRPTNYMGASKRISELICQAFTSVQETKTVFSIVRFGNVLGSSGSVFPKFQQQISSGGPLTVTHPKITRYFMTITEAAQLVIQAGALAKGGEVFVLDMGKPVKIIDLAKKIAQLHGLRPYISGVGDVLDIEIKITGLKPGEKLYEELFVGGKLTKTRHERIMAANEANLSLNELEPLLSDLYEAAETYDKNAIKNIFEKLPISMKTSDLSNDTLLSS